MVEYLVYEAFFTSEAKKNRTAVRAEPLCDL